MSQMGSVVQSPMEYTNTDKSAKKRLPDEAGLGVENGIDCKIKHRVVEETQEKSQQSESTSIDINNIPALSGCRDPAIVGVLEILGRIESRLISVDNTGQATNNELKDIKTNIDQMKIDIGTNASDIKSVRDELKQEVAQLRAELEETRNTVQSNKSNVEKNEEANIKQELYSRKLNILLKGVPVQRGESPETLKVEIGNLTAKLVKVDVSAIDVAHRLGGTGPNDRGPAMTLVRFKYLEARNKVWGERAQFSQRQDGPPIWLSEDVPQKLRGELSQVKKTYWAAKNYGQFTSVKMSGTTLFLGGKSYSKNNWDKLPPWLGPAALSTFEDQDSLVFFGKASPLSNHHKADFEIAGKTYSTAEKFIAIQRCQVARRPDLEKEAWRLDDPVKLKSILYKCRGCHDDEWEAKAKSLVLPGIKAKVEQNDYIKQYLIGSGKKTIGEASPNNLWGIGMKLTAPNVLKQELWSGRNLLGKILQEVREGMDPDSSP